MFLSVSSIYHAILSRRHHADGYRILPTLMQSRPARHSKLYRTTLVALSVFAVFTAYTTFFSPSSPVIPYSPADDNLHDLPPPDARKVPFRRDCGPWQNVRLGRDFVFPASHAHLFFAQPYRELHKRIIAREAPQRYVTWRCNPDTSPYQYESAWCGGLRDRTFGYINAFLYALLNDRAFLMDSKVRKSPRPAGFPKGF
jgi:hypothetical protein